MMQSRHHSPRAPRTHGNLALADEVADAFPLPASLRSPVRRLAHGVLEEGLAGDQFAPGMRLLVGAGLSVMLWCVIVMVIIGCVTLVQSTLAG